MRITMQAMQVARLKTMTGGAQHADVQVSLLVSQLLQHFE
jgi:hypothetical protein